jgi:predicted amidophosphoribosyltransferase
MDNLLHQVFYGKCYLCEEFANPICETCFDKLVSVKSPFELSGIKKIISFYEYTDISRRILQISKYPPYEFFLLNYLSRLTFKKNRENLLNFLNPDNSLIFCPVPLNSLKLFERKFNQAEEISLCLSEVSASSLIILIQAVACSLTTSGSSPRFVPDSEVPGCPPGSFAGSSFFWPKIVLNNVFIIVLQLYYII